MELDLKNNNLDNNQTELLSKLLTTLSTEQRIWLGGYLSGLNESTSSLLQILIQNNSRPVVQSSKQSQTMPLLKIMFGTRSGNSQMLANKAHSIANSIGVKTKLEDLNDYNPKNLKNEKYIIFIVSTDGEGEPPFSVEEFYNFIFSKKAPDLTNLRYSVMALGDSSYKHFCKVGKDIDKQLEELGAKRFLDRIDCDVDFTVSSDTWLNESIKVFKDKHSVQEENIQLHEEDTHQSNEYNRDNPWYAPVLDNIVLNGRGSTKQIHHIELSIEGSGIKYAPGDSVGIVCQNSTETVEELLSELPYSGDQKVIVNNEEIKLYEVLQRDVEITRLTPNVIADYAKIANNSKLNKLISSKKQLDEYLYKSDIIDLVSDFKSDISAQDFVKLLRKLQPRLYSISSSYNDNPNEVHITVSAVRYAHNKRIHKGVCSDFLATLPTDDISIPIYIDKNIGFRLPEEHTIPIIMIGAGTGIAPYRAFIQERALHTAAGKSWIFFGERNFATDFLYQSEWQKHLKNGQLSKMDIAFSRDQEDKLYVQHKLNEQSKEVYKWIKDGAYVYLCGDKNSMANDVKKTLVEIIKREGGYSDEKALDYFNKIRKERRFQEDVY